MTAALFSVVQAGAHVTVQDGGRQGAMRFGVPASGPMDRRALALANLALGNDPAAAGIEVSLGGLVLDCQAGAVTLAVAGGGFIVEAGGRRGGSWQVLTLRAGERLAVRPGPWGSWCCIAFAGRLDVPRWMGSAATHGPSGLGGGRLGTGGRLRVAEPRVQAGSDGAIPCPVWARARSVVHLVPGPQERFFSPATLATLSEGVFRLTDAYDRMGVRLRGPALWPERALAIPSEAIVRGSVQVSGEGVATVLLADHQTTGGYPKIATMLDDDTDGFAQLRPHDTVRFRLIPAAEALRLARLRARLWRDYCARSAARSAGVFSGGGQAT
jgi:allophanate hydrolase